MIDYLETMNGGTGQFDLSLSETVWEALDFDYDSGVKWSCIRGGAQKIAIAMEATLAKKPLFNRRVTALAYEMPDPAESKVNVSMNHTNTDGKTQKLSESYDHVITTMPFGCLRMVDTRQCMFPWQLKNAIRMLNYGASVKVGIKFTDRWWEMLQNPQFGGVSSTDRPTRMVVYPSYGQGTKAATMLCCYNWQQDALRYGAFVKGRNSPEERQLIDMILEDLAILNPEMTFDALSEKVVDWHAWNWHSSPYSCGAFAEFAPSQFQDLYTQVTQPAAGGLLHFAGEATSVHHAWVVGALNSAYRSVWEIIKHEDREDLEMKLKNNWGTVDELKDNLVTRQIRIGERRFFEKYDATQ